MKRRSFVKSSIITGALATWLPGAAMAVGHAENLKKSNQEFYELRVYTLNNLAQQKIIEDYFKDAAIPVLNRLGTKNIGVFTELEPTGQTKIYVIIPFKSLEDYLNIQEKMSRDEVYNQAASSYLNAPAKVPAYERLESSLLKAFIQFPAIDVPPNKARMFELRRYESPGENAGKKKIEMFNEGGEIKIFKRVGLTPVFMGETIIGGLRPNLTYMITFDDMAEHDRNWKIFRDDPEWKKLSAIPEYGNDRLISKITSIYLVATSFSQV
ncbi:MAG: NIPSNAP family protein [Sphingobacteriaceae bacterium]